MNTVAESERQAIAEHVQREVERVALRKVRKLTDRLEDEERDAGRLERRALKLGAAAIVVMLSIILSLVLTNQRDGEPRRIEIPGKVATPPK